MPRVPNMVIMIVLISLYTSPRCGVVISVKPSWHFLLYLWCIAARLCWRKRAGLVPTARLFAVAAAGVPRTVPLLTTSILYYGANSWRMARQTPPEFYSLQISGTWYTRVDHITL